MNKLSRLTTVLGLWVSLLAAPAGAGAYDPLAVDDSQAPAWFDTTVHDAARARDIPIRVYLPTNTVPEPVVLFSHGLGGTRAGSAFMGRQWAERGYVAVFLQHPGSDDSVWKNTPLGQRMSAMQDAASLTNFWLRVYDVPAVLNQLESWEADNHNRLAGRMDLKKIGMSGHSFGAVTTEAVSGEVFPGNQKFTDPRITAAIAFSPSIPRGGGDSASMAFGSVSIPWMLMTGTNDISPIGGMDAKSRLAVYPALHLAPKYQVVLYGAEHSVFTDRPLPNDQEPRNPNHHRVILALSTAYWDAYLRGDTNALAWLNGSGPRSVMEAKDQWQLADH